MHPELRWNNSWASMCPKNRLNQVCCLCASRNASTLNIFVSAFAVFVKGQAASENFVTGKLTKGLEALEAVVAELKVICQDSPNLASVMHRYSFSLACYKVALGRMTEARNEMMKALVTNNALHQDQSEMTCITTITLAYGNQTLI